MGKFGYKIKKMEGKDEIIKWPSCAFLLLRERITEKKRLTMTEKGGLRGQRGSPREMGD